ncbi:MAG: hypothetical protein ACRC6U_08105, partial [Fusobacteriaceae bacterium]
MIGIDEAKIKEFSLIKDMHEKWYMKSIFPTLETVIKNLEGYAKSNENLRIYMEILKKIEKKKEKFVTDEKIPYYLLNRSLSEFVFKPSKLEEELKRLKVNDYENFTPQKIFKYEKLKTEAYGWGRHQLLSKLGIEVCPYC